MTRSMDQNRLVLEIPVLHAVTDRRLVEQDSFFARAEQLVRAGAGAVHLRAHGLEGRRLFDLAVRLRALTSESGALLIVNDRLDVALAAGADAFHLGQRSIPLERAADLCREKGLAFGYSCHSLEQALEARKHGAAYVYLGTIFPSASKPGAPAAGVGLVAGVASRVDCPVIAIGGITPANAARVAGLGAYGCAAISGLWNAENPRNTVREYLAAFHRA